VLISRSCRIHTLGLILVSLATSSASAQVDQERAAQYFREASALCEREGGRIWGVSLCGPMVIADAKSQTIATNQTPPDAKRPAALGFANAAIDWGGTRWTTLIWIGLPANEPDRGRLMVHELFHRVQPQLGLFLNDQQAPHLDTPDGRYWIQLEWRALAKALESSSAVQSAAIADALAFRKARHAAFQGSAEIERVLEINEGLAQYTGTVVVHPAEKDAAADTVKQLAQAEKNVTFVRTFPYPSGAGYGVLLDRFSPAWPRNFKPTDDLGQMLMTAARVDPAANPDEAAARYGGPELKIAEAKREEARRIRVAELRKRFVEGPVLTLPGSTNNSFVTTGMTPIPDAGTVYPSFRATAEWGTLESEATLMASDRSKLTVPGPAKVDGSVITGIGWTVKLAPGWIVRPGARAGDFEVVREK
jgi:hypothetical protein